MENEQNKSEPSSNIRLLNSERTNDLAEESPESRFQLMDLTRLIFVSGNDQAPRALDCWSSSAAQFQAFIGQFGTVENVDVNAWGPFDRLEYVNGLWQHCQENGCTFPFQFNPVEQLEKQRKEGARQKRY
jgi:hypothetical protein